MDDFDLRSDEQFRAFLVCTFDVQDSVRQPLSRFHVEDMESGEPGYKTWLREEILKILRDNSTSIEDRLFQYTDNKFDGGAQTAWDFWAYIWETVTYGEPWPADLPVINPERFAYLRTDLDE